MLCPCVATSFFFRADFRAYSTANILFFNFFSRVLWLLESHAFALNV